VTPLAHEAWKRLARSLSTDGLSALARGLQSDDPRIVQGESGMEEGDVSFRRGDPVAFALAEGDNIRDWETLSVAWMEHMRQCDGGFGPGEIKSWALLAWWDCNPREVVRVELLLLVAAELDRRRALPLKVSLC
jgi:hypothetical protein